MSTSANLGPNLVVGNWIEAGFATVIVCLRLLAKLRIRQFALDDVVMIAALCSTIVGSAMVTTAVHYGLGRSIETLPQESVPKAVMYDYLAQAFGLGGSCFSRIAFILYLINLLGTRKAHRVVLWVLLWLQLVTHFVTILLIFIQCPGNTAAVFDHTINANCWSPVVQVDNGFFQGSFNTATDLYLSVFPAYILWNLKLQLRIKISVMILLGLGLFAMVASLIKTIQIRVLSITQNPTVDTVVLVRWLYIETYLVIITASVPCTRPLFNSFKNTMSSNELSNNTFLSSSRYGDAGSQGGLHSQKQRVHSRYVKYDDTGSEELILQSMPANSTHIT